jgi:hypothetical protein
MRGSPAEPGGEEDRQNSAQAPGDPETLESPRRGWDGDSFTFHVSH